jgi:hypothetical protein
MFYTTLGNPHTPVRRCGAHILHKYAFFAENEKLGRMLRRFFPPLLNFHLKKYLLYFS